MHANTQTRAITHSRNTYPQDVEYAAFWTNSSRAVLEVATGDCSDETHFRNLTYEATVGLLSSHLAHGTELTPADVPRFRRLLLRLWIFVVDGG